MIGRPPTDPVKFFRVLTLPLDPSLVKDLPLEQLALPLHEKINYNMKFFVFLLLIIASLLYEVWI